MRATIRAPPRPRPIARCARRLSTAPQRPRVLLLAGPTGVGKSRLSIEVAKRLNGEIISADSATVFRRMDIGTTKPDVNSLATIPHYLINVVNPSDDYSVQQWATEAEKHTKDILSRGKVPIVVGGTAFYFHWYIYGGRSAPQIPVHPNDSEDYVKENYYESLERLRASAPEYAASISGYHVNVRRVARALQKIRAGVALPLLRDMAPALSEEELRYDFRGIVLTQPRVSLLPVLDYRCEKIVQAGLIEETANLILQHGLKYQSQPGLAVGYRQTIEYLLNGTFTASGFRTYLSSYQASMRNLVRKQETWYRKSERYKWLLKPPTDAVIADTIVRLYNCPIEEYQAFVDTAPRVLSKEDAETLRQYKPQTALFTYGLAAKQARIAEQLSHSVRPLLQAQQAERRNRSVDDEENVALDHR